MAKIQIVGTYKRNGSYLYSNTAPFKIGILSRSQPKPHQPPQYLMLFPHNAERLPNGKPNMHLSGLFPKPGGVYKIEYGGRYYCVTMTATEAIIKPWSSSQTSAPEFS